MKKLLFMGLAVGAVIAFVGSDVVGSAFSHARTSIRTALTKDLPLETRLAEAKARIDAYAENIIDGEVAAANMQDMIRSTEREVRTLTVRVDHERGTLIAMRGELESEVGTDGLQVVVATGTGAFVEERASREAMLHVRSFRATSEMLARRESDLTRLKQQYTSTQKALAQARTERVRLSQEARVLETEVASMNARRAAAQTRQAVGNHSITSSGFAEASSSLKAIRTEIRKQNKLLKYYETRYELQHGEFAATPDYLPEPNPGQAIDEALASYPSQR